MRIPKVKNFSRPFSVNAAISRYGFQLWASVSPSFRTGCPLALLGRPSARFFLEETHSLGEEKQEHRRLPARSDCQDYLAASYCECGQRAPLSCGSAIAV